MSKSYLSMLHEDVYISVNMAFSLTVLFIIGPVLFFFVRVPYGKFSGKLLGFFFDVELPMRFAWFFQESWNFACLYEIFKQGITLGNLIVLSPFLIHYFHRVFIFTFVKRSKSSKYSLIVMLIGVFHCGGTGIMLGRYFTAYADYPLDYVFSLNFICGLVTFLIGMTINISSDYHLISLRTESRRYALPTMGLFKYVTQPNYLGELIEWVGFAWMSGWWRGCLCLICVTIANLVPRAVQSKHWYKEKFNVDRYAIIPFFL